MVVVKEESAPRRLEYVKLRDKADPDDESCLCNHQPGLLLQDLSIFGGVPSTKYSERNVDEKRWKTVIHGIYLLPIDSIRQI